MRAIDATLKTALESGEFDPSTRVYSEPHLPSFTLVVGTDAGPVNAIGHDVLYINGHLYHARSGLVASPANGHLYFTHITSFADPSTWNSNFVSIATGVMAPHYDVAQDAQQMAIAADGTGNVQLFYFVGNKLYCLTSANHGGSWGGAVEIVEVGDSEHCMCASPGLDEVYVTNVQDVANGYSGTTPIDCIERYTYSGSWSLESHSPYNSYVFAKMGRHPGDYSDRTASTEWGNPVWGGLGVVEIDTDKNLIVAGGVIRDALGPDGSQQGIVTFIHNTETGLWEESTLVSPSDYDETTSHFDVFVRGSLVDGLAWLCWRQEDEPSDVVQSVSSQEVPRQAEIVYAYSIDGIHFTECHTVSVNADDVCTGPIILIDDKLYMIGWNRIMQSDATHIVGYSSPTDISSQLNGWQITTSGRSPESVISLQCNDPENLSSSPGDLITVEAGITTKREKVGHGFLVGYEETLRLGKWGGSVDVKASWPLAQTRSRDNVDIFPQENTYIAPGNAGEFAILDGTWQVIDDATWIDTALGGDAPDKVIELSSHPSPGNFHQMVHLMHPATRNGSVEASIRMGLKDYWGAEATNENLIDGDSVVKGTVSFSNSFATSAVIPAGGTSYPCNLCAAGIGVRCDGTEKGFLFVWEGSDITDELDPYLDHQNIVGPGDHFTGDLTTWKANELHLYLFNEDSTDRELLNVSTLPSLVLGDIVRLKMIVQDNTIYCYYALGVAGAWSLVFTYTTAIAQSAGRFSLYGRAYNGAVRQDYMNGMWYYSSVDEDNLVSTAITNNAYFWNIRVASGARQITLKDVLTDISWRAGVEIETFDYDSLSDVDTQDVVIDSEMKLTVGATAGFDVRKTGTSYVRITLTQASPGIMTVVGVLSGVTQDTIATYAAIDIPKDVWLPIRVVAQGDWYTVWIGQLFVGSIYYPFSAGTEVAEYGSTFQNSAVSELCLVPQFATIDAKQSMLAAIQGVIRQRRIKQIYTYEGKLRFSYCRRGSGIDDAVARAAEGLSPALLTLNSIRRNSSFINHCRVVGAEGWADYLAPEHSLYGRRFAEIHLPDVMTRGQMWNEAKAIVRESIELSEQDNFVGIPDLQLEPEDWVMLNVAQQGITNAWYIVDDVSLAWNQFKLEQSIGTRQRVEDTDL